MERKEADAALEKENIHAGHRERLRKRFDAAGAKGFEEHTFLELLLFYVIPRKDTNPIAHELLRRFGSLERVLSASAQELMQVEDIGQNAARYLTMLGTLPSFLRDGQQKKRVVLDSSVKVGEYLVNQFLGKQMETMMVLCLNSRKEPFFCGELGQGTSNSTVTSVREIAYLCSRVNATDIILSHNHPSGMSLPSVSDIVMTKKAEDFLKEIGVTVLDHFIITDQEFFSMKDHKLF